MKQRIPWAPLASALLMVACGRACGAPVMATVAAAADEVQRDHASSIGTWVAAPVSAELATGEAVRTGAPGSATLRLRGGGGLRLGANALVRFGGEPEAEAPTLEVESGEVEVEAADVPIDIVTELGRATLEGGGRLRAVRTEEGTSLEVLVGIARMEAGPQLEIGEPYGVVFADLDDGGVPPDPDAGVPPALDGGAVAVLDAGVQAILDGGAELEGAPEAEVNPNDESPSLGTNAASIAAVEFVVAPGAGGVVHHPAPPARVGVQTGCPNGMVTVRGSGGVTTYTGGGLVGVQLPAGRSRYEVRCGAEDAEPRTGRFTVTGDAGRRRLNTTSRRYPVDADGRRYTFLYEGALPTLTLRWPEAPAAESYSVRLTGTRGGSSRTTSRPAVTLRPRHLREGEMSFRFEAAGRQSRTTRVTLRYDTATPAAYVASPGDRGFAPGATVSVSGTAQPGSTVSAGAGPIEVSRGGSFEGSGRAASAGIAVRISTPRRGTHYFVRRASGG